MRVAHQARLATERVPDFRAKPAQAVEVVSIFNPRAIAAGCHRLPGDDDARNLRNMGDSRPPLG